MATKSKLSEHIFVFEGLFWNELLRVSPRRNIRWVPQLVFFPTVFFVSRLAVVGKQKFRFGHVHFSRNFRAVERSKFPTYHSFGFKRRPLHILVHVSEEMNCKILHLDGDYDGGPTKLRSKSRGLESSPAAHGGRGATRSGIPVPGPPSGGTYIHACSCSVGEKEGAMKTGTSPKAVWKRERERVCVCVCVCMRERDRRSASTLFLLVIPEGGEQMKRGHGDTTAHP